MPFGCVLSAHALWHWSFSRAVRFPWCIHMPGLPVRAESIYHMHGLIDSRSRFYDCVLVGNHPSVRLRAFVRLGLQGCGALSRVCFALHKHSLNDVGARWHATHSRGMRIGWAWGQLRARDRRLWAVWTRGCVRLCSDWALQIAKIGLVKQSIGGLRNHS